MMRQATLTIIGLIIFFSGVVNAQSIIVEHGSAWSKATVLNSRHYQGGEEWRGARRTGGWLVIGVSNRNSLLIGGFVTDRRIYFTRHFPDYTTQDLIATIARKEKVISLASVFERRILDANQFSIITGIGYGIERVLSTEQISQSQYAGSNTLYIKDESFFLRLRGTAILRASLNYTPAPRWTIGIQSAYNTPIALRFSKSIDRYIPQTFALSFRLGYRFGNR